MAGSGLFYAAAVTFGLAAAFVIGCLIQVLR